MSALFARQILFSDGDPMKLKQALVGLVIAAGVTVPVIAHGAHVDPPIGEAVVQDSDDSGIFGNWSTRSGHWFLNFGDVDASQPNAVGLRITPSEEGSEEVFKGWSMDINTRNGAQPFFQTYGHLLGTNSTFQLSEADANAPDSRAYRVHPIGHGYKTVQYSEPLMGMDVRLPLTPFIFWMDLEVPAIPSTTS